MKKKPKKVRRDTVWSDRLRRLRAKLNLSQAAAAQRFGVAVSVWKAWEHGFNLPSKSNAELLRIRFPELD